MLSSLDAGVWEGVGVRAGTGARDGVGVVVGIEVSVVTAWDSTICWLEVSLHPVSKVKSAIAPMEVIINVFIASASLPLQLYRLMVTFTDISSIANGLVHMKRRIRNKKTTVLRDL